MKSQGSEELGKILDRLTQEIYSGRMHLWVWRYLNNALVAKPRVRKVAPVFFALSLRAHSNESFLHLSRLFDKKSETVRLRRLLEIANKNAGRFQKISAAEVRRQITLQGKVLGGLESKSKPVLARRNKILAHLDRKVLEDDEHNQREDGITIGEMEWLYEQCGQFVNDISLAYRGSMTVMELVGWEDFQHLILYLERALQSYDEEKERFLHKIESAAENQLKNDH